jgi:hypothetical protein
LVQFRNHLDHVRVKTPWQRKKYIQFIYSTVTLGDWEGAPTLPSQHQVNRFCSAFSRFKMWPSSKQNEETGNADLYSVSFNFIKFARALGMPWWNEHPIKLALYSIGISTVTAGALGYWLGMRRSGN